MEVSDIGVFESQAIIMIVVKRAAQDCNTILYGSSIYGTS